MSGLTEFIRSGGGRTFLMGLIVGFAGAIALADASQRAGFMELAQMGLAGYLGSLVPKPQYPSSGDSV